MIEGSTIVGILKDEKQVQSDKIRKFTVTQPDPRYDAKEKKTVYATEYIDVILNAAQGEAFAKAIQPNDYVILNGGVKVNAYTSKEGVAKYSLEMEFPTWKKLPKKFENNGATSSSSSSSTPKNETVVEETYEEDLV